MVDLPGLYSLSAFSSDEKAVLDYLKATPPNLIINVVDGTNLERSLSLTIDLLRLHIPIILAVNMCDDLEKSGVKFNDKKLSILFGVKVYKISALKNIGVDEMMSFILKANNYQNERFTLDKDKDKFQFIHENIDDLIEKKQTSTQKHTQRIDAILTHKIFGFPILILTMALVYLLSIKVGGFLGSFVQDFFNIINQKTQAYLTSINVYPWTVSLTCDAIISGLGNVLTFLPQILVLFALMTIIEESGYASRIAFILDRIFRPFYLSGKSVIPLVLSSGCTVSGIMASRTIASESERKMTVFLCPFMPCSAKLALFAFFSTKLFSGSVLLALSMYLLSIFAVAIGGIVLNRFKCFKEDFRPFFLEMPTLRIPSLFDVYSVLKEKCKDFMIKAGAIVFILSVILWALKNLGLHGYCPNDITKSFLFLIGDKLSYIFYPLGFGSWQASISVLTGFMAKEGVIESLSLLTEEVSTVFDNPYSVYAFCAFILLSPPCVASISVARKELNDNKTFAFMLVFQFLMGYVVAIIINSIGILVQAHLGLLYTLAFVIIIGIGILFSIKRLRKSCSKNCSTCSCKRKKYENNV